jgi:hypothetical protein
MKNLIILVTILFLSGFLNAQTWKFSNSSFLGTYNYTLTKISDGLYTLKADFSDGKSCTSQLKRFQLRYDNVHQYQKYTINDITISTGPAKKEEYCVEKIVSGNGSPWSTVIIRWLNDPICIDNCRDIEVVVLNSNGEVEEAYLPYKY